MGKLAVTEFVSVDGVFEDPGGAEDYEHGGWTFEYDLQPFGGTGYTGSWGSGTYILGVGPTRDRVTDPRRRSEYTDPFAAVQP